LQHHVQSKHFNDFVDHAVNQTEYFLIQFIVQLCSFHLKKIWCLSYPKIDETWVEFYHKTVMLVRHQNSQLLWELHHCQRAKADHKITTLNSKHPFTLGLQLYHLLMYNKKVLWFSKKFILENFTEKVTMPHKMSSFLSSSLFHDDFMLFNQTKAILLSPCLKHTKHLQLFLAFLLSVKFTSLFKTIFTHS